MTETMFCDRKLLHPTFHFGMQNHFKGIMLVFVSLPFMTSRTAFEINSQRGPAVVHPPPPHSNRVLETSPRGGGLMHGVSLTLIFN